MKIDIINTIKKMNQTESDFCIEIKFDKGTENPSRVFKTMSNLIESFQAIDHDLIIPIDSKIEPVLLLEDIESSSLRAWLINKVKNMPDNILKEGEVKKVIGHYLVKAKYIIIKMLDKKDRIESKDDILQIENDILKLAVETNIRKFPAYVPPDTQKLIKGIENITKALSSLSEKDSATYIVGNEKANFNLGFNFLPDEIEDLVTAESIQQSTTEILKVKKPDYLGESMWEFKRGQIAIYAKMSDKEWLSDFQNRKIDVRPGDSIKAQIETIMKYDYDHNLIASRYSIQKVLKVLHSRISGQLDLIP